LAHIDNDKIAIRYRLTTVGEYWIDPANDTISEPAAREPQADSLHLAILRCLNAHSGTIWWSADDVREILLLDEPNLEDYSKPVIENKLKLMGSDGDLRQMFLAKSVEYALQPATSTPVSDSGAYRMGFVEGLGLLDEIGNQELAESLAKVSDYLAEHHLNKPGSIKIDELLKDAIRLRSQLAALASERDAANARVAELEAENAVLGIVISSVGIKVHDARDLLFDEKYAAADGELKNAEVIIRANRGNDATD
jgi:hypothetical protein